MYLSFRRLRHIFLEDLPDAVRDGAPIYPVWLCIDELGNLIIADTVSCPARFWDPKKKCWRECSTDSVMIKY